MNRRDFLKSVGASLLTAPAWSSLFAAEASASGPQGGARPNVILVLCDDLGWGDLGAFWQNERKAKGLPHIETPNLDRAMRRGVQMTQAYSSAPVCAPARASMVTGKSQGHCNLRDNMFDRPIDPRMTIGTVMKQAGYTTWHIGKWGIGGGYESGGQPRRAMACDAGFDYSYGYPAHSHGHSFYHFECDSWRNSKMGSPLVENVSAQAYAEGRYNELSAGACPFEKDPDGTYLRRLVSNAEARYCYDTDLFTAKIKQLILQHREAQRAEPFFCYACYTTVHGSGSRNGFGDPSLKSTDDFHVPGRPYPAAEAKDKRWGGGVKWEKDARGFLPFKEIDAQGNNTSNTFIAPEAKGYATDSLRRYATNVQRLDEALGDLFRFLKLQGLDENTLFIFTSDNGPAGEYVAGFPSRIAWVEGAFDSNGPYKGMKRWMNEGGLREPTFVVWPKGIRGGRDAQRTCDTPFQFTAWMATLAEVAGLPAPAHCDGVSILPALTGKGRQRASRIYSEQMDGEGARGFTQMVRDGDYVLVRTHGVNGDVALYNVKDDPGQEKNLAQRTEQAKRLQRMKNLLVTCRIPASKVPDAYGTPAAYAQTPGPIDAQPYPALDYTGPMPKPQAYLFFKGAEAWPWVPQFHVLSPEDSFAYDSAAELRKKLSALRVPYGLAVTGFLEVPETQEVTFTAKGPAGCQLWLHEAHILDYERGGCAEGRAVTLKLAKGRHPYRLYLTGACRVSAGATELA